MDATGMPRLRPETADSVFFLYGRNPKTGELTGPHGTGFIVVRDANIAELKIHYYAVTNWHVSNRLGASIIRLNTKDGRSRFLEYDPIDWKFVPNGDDISAVDITDDLRKNDELVVANEFGFLTPFLIDHFKIGLGEDVFMIGLFSDQYGGERNTPAARFGNVALLANKDALIKQPNGIRRPSHLLDMRSRTGFSGSPVTIFRTPQNDISNMPPTNEKLLKVGFGLRKYGTSENYFTSLLGIHCVQFWDKVEVYKKPPDSELDGDPIHEGDKLNIQSGMTIVAPAAAVTELLNLREFEMIRQKRDNKRAEKSLTNPAARRRRTTARKIHNT